MSYWEARDQHEEERGRRGRRTDEYAPTEQNPMIWWMARTGTAAEENETIHITCFPSESIFTMIWKVQKREAITGTRVDRSRFKGLEIRRWEVDARGSCWLKKTTDEWQDDRTDMKKTPKSVLVFTLNRELRGLRTARSTQDSKHGKGKRGNSKYVAKDQTQQLAGYLLELQGTGDHDLAAMLDSVIYQASGAKYSIRDLPESQWWVTQHPIPSAEEAAAWAKEPSATPHTSDPELEQDLTATAGSSVIKKDKKPFRGNWMISECSDIKGRTTLHLTLFPSPEIFALVCDSAISKARTGMRLDGCMGAPLTMWGWEFDRKPSGSSYPRRFDADLYTPKDIEEGQAELVAQRAFLLRRDAEGDDVTPVPGPVEEFLGRLLERGPPMDPKSLESYLKEQDEKGESWRRDRLETLIHQASDGRLTILADDESDAGQWPQSDAEPGSADAPMGIVSEPLDDESSLLDLLFSEEQNQQQTAMLADPPAAGTAVPSGSESTVKRPRVRAPEVFPPPAGDDEYCE